LIEEGFANGDGAAEKNSFLDCVKVQTLKPTLQRRYWKLLG